MTKLLRRAIAAYACLAVIGAIGAIALRGESTATAAEAPAAPVAAQDRYLSTDGAALYAASCQACHMADGKGATGAGTYPALAANANLEDPGYALYVVANGHKAMVSFGRTMNDEQIASVVTYVRTHFGNAYADPVKPEDVKAVRP